MPFYLRTLSAVVQGTTQITRWTNHQSTCCSTCFKKLSRLQLAKFAMSVVGIVPLAIVGVIVFLLKKDMSNLALVAMLTPAAMGLLGLVVVEVMRASLLRSPHIAPTIQLLKSVHKLNTGHKSVKVIPLATLRGFSLFEADR